jgi:UDP-glucuronate 4-epimerase
MKGKKILITGVAGNYARPVAEALAVDNEVYGLSIFNEGEQKARAELEAKGIKCFAWDMNSEPVPSDVPAAEITHVLHTAMLRETDDYDAAIDVNSYVVAKLMTQFKHVESFCFVSSHGLYKRQPNWEKPDWRYRYKETDAIGGGLKFIPAYQVSKIAAEAVVRALCKLYNMPVIITRPNVVYGNYSWGGSPILFLRKMMAGEPVEAPLNGDLYSMPIHGDDVAAMQPALFAAAKVPAEIVNLAGDEEVSDVEYLTWISEITGVPVTFKKNDDYFRDMFCTDNTKRRQIAGDAKVGWKEGIRKSITAHFPDLALREND